MDSPTENKIATSHDDSVTSLEERMAELTAELLESKKAQAEETQTVLNARRDEVITSITDFNDLTDPESDVWERITAAECVGIEIKLVPGEDGEPPILSKVLVSAAAPKARKSSGGGTGTRRDLEGEFRAVATTDQVAWLEAHKESTGNDGRGVRWGYMNKITKSDDPTGVAVPAN